MSIALDTVNIVKQTQIEDIKQNQMLGRIQTY